MINLDEIAVFNNTTIKEAFEILEKTGVGILLLINDDNTFNRTVSDGDLRRLILSGHQLRDKLENLPQKKSYVLNSSFTRQEAFDLMNEHLINHLPVVDEDGVILELLDRKYIAQKILLSSPHMGSEEKTYVDEAFESNWIAPLGPNVDSFENELANYVGVKHAAALSSGTAAIHMALRLLNIHPGDRVFCSSLTFVASANPILYQFAEPIFIDSNRTSWNMCPKALNRAFEIASKEGWMPKAVIVVNLYGQSADMDSILEICRFYKVPLIEDAAESLGSKYKKQYSGTFGDLGVFSFNGNKIITTSGGGMLVSPNQDYIERARFYATQARDSAPYYQHSEIGYNYRMSNILAGVGRGQLKVLQDRVNARRRIFEFYRSNLSEIEEIEWMPEPEWSYSNRWLSVATLSKESSMTSLEFIQKLQSEMIETRPVWKPMHLQPLFKGARYFSESRESVSDDLFERGVCFPSGSNMDDEQLQRVVMTVKKVFKKHL